MCVPHSCTAVGGTEDRTGGACFLVAVVSHKYLSKQFLFFVRFLCRVFSHGGLAGADNQAVTRESFCRQVEKVLDAKWFKMEKERWPEGFDPANFADNADEEGMDDDDMVGVSEGAALNALCSGSGMFQKLRQIRLQSKASVGGEGRARRGLRGLGGDP